MKLGSRGFSLGYIVRFDLNTQVGGVCQALKNKAGLEMKLSGSTYPLQNTHTVTQTHPPHLPASAWTQNHPPKVPFDCLYKGKLSDALLGGQAGRAGCNLMTERLNVRFQCLVLLAMRGSSKELVFLMRFPAHSLRPRKCEMRRSAELGVKSYV